MNKLTSVEIICTLGPSSLNNDTLLAFEELGVTLLRINLSHTQVDGFLRSHPKADILLDFYPDLLDIN